MSKSQTIDISHNYVRIALPLMAKHEVPITPPNYAVWYKHVSGSDKELSTAIQKLIDGSIVFSKDVNDKLYWQYCAQREEIALKKIRESIQEILVSIFSEIVGMNSHTQHYENVILNSVAKLSEDVPAEEIGRIVGQIINETKEMVNFGSTLQQKLEQANADLEVIKKEFKQAKTESLMDFLTGIPNRKAFDEMLARVIKEADKASTDFSILLIDIDHFKAFNDKHGHIIGDKVLRFVAQKSKELLKGRDFIARFGGEEFAVILPLTEIIGAASAAENIQKYFEESELKVAVTADKLGTITLSIGVAAYQHSESVETLIKRADQALYLAKANGRNQVVTELDLAKNVGKSRRKLKTKK